MNHPSPRTNPTRARFQLALRLGAIGLIGALALVTGCSKPPPPPPPPAPAPPPPPPPNIKLEDVSQELHVDARVQVAPGLEVGPSEADLAKAVVQLADAIAKGDAKAARSLLTRNAQTILDTLDTEGLWTAGTSKIEAVRIVAVQPGVSFGAQSGPPTSAAEIGAIAGDVMGQLLAALPEEARKQLTDAVAGTGQQALTEGQDLSGAQVARMDAAIAKARELGVPADVLSKVEALKSQLSSNASTSPDAVTGTGILLAIQDPMGAYLLGWQADQAGGSWLFTNAPANSAVRPRASAWDGIGQAGFGEGTLAAAEEKADGSPNLGNNSSGSEPSSPSEPPPSAPSEPGPRKKNTPAGPVTIPGG